MIPRKLVGCLAWHRASGSSGQAAQSGLVG